MGDIDEPFLLLSAMPRKEISVNGTLSDLEITHSTVLHVEERDDGFNVAKVGSLI